MLECNVCEWKQKGCQGRKGHSRRKLWFLKRGSRRGGLVRKYNNTYVLKFHNQTTALNDDLISKQKKNKVLYPCYLKCVP